MGCGGRLPGTLAGPSFFGLSIFVCLAAVFVCMFALVPAVSVSALFIFLLSVFPLLFLLLPVSVLVLVSRPVSRATRLGRLSVLGAAADFLLLLLFGRPADTRYFEEDLSVTVYQSILSFIIFLFSITHSLTLSPIPLQCGVPFFWGGGEEEGRGIQQCTRLPLSNNEQF